MRKYVLLLLAAGLSLAFAPAPLPKPPRPDRNKEELKKLQGTWVRVVLSNNQPAGAAAVDGTRVVIVGNRMTYVLSTTALNEWSIALDATKKPKAFDNEGIGSLPAYRGVYRLDGDTLTVCSRPGSTEADRPTDLEGTQPRVVREVFIRQRP